MKDGVFYSEKTGRAMERHGSVTSIYWSPSMIDYLRRHFSNTLNEELAGCLGVSQRTMLRKAYSLGLKKDPVWLHAIYKERSRMARSAASRKGHPGGFRKGCRNNPDGEFGSGRRLTPEQEQRRRSSIRRWCLLNPDKVMARAMKIAATKRRNAGAVNN